MGSVAAAFLPWRALGGSTGALAGDSQHVGDDSHAPHVRGEGNKVVVHHFGSQELRSPKIHLQLLTGFVPVQGKEPRVRSWGAPLTKGRARQGFWECGRGAEPSTRAALGWPQGNIPSLSLCQSKARRKNKDTKPCKGLPWIVIAALASARHHRMLSSRCCPKSIKHKPNKAVLIIQDLESIWLLGCTQLQLRVNKHLHHRCEHNLTTKVGLRRIIWAGEQVTVTPHRGNYSILSAIAKQGKVTRLDQQQLPLTIVE